MRVRVTLILTGIVSSILGALVVYLVLSVPNDLRADALLKQARQDIAGGDVEQARQSLLKIVQQHPRTDAAAAATAALLSLEKKARDDLARAITLVRAQNAEQSRQSAHQAKLLAGLQQSVTELRNAPPRVVTVAAPAPKPPATKVQPKKKASPAKKPTRRKT